MTTDPTIDPSEQTPEMDTPVDPTPDPSKEPTQETVESLTEKLAVAQTEAKRWKGRVEKATKEDKPIPVTEQDMTWAIANTARVNLVKDAYTKHLEDLQALGAKTTNDLREKALKLAEAETGVTKTVVETSEDGLPSPSVDRSGHKAPKLTSSDQAMGVKPETVKEFGEYVEGR